MKFLEKLSIIFRTVALFNMLMQNFYKITQGSNKESAFIHNKIKRAP